MANNEIIVLSDDDDFVTEPSQSRRNKPKVNILQCILLGRVNSVPKRYRPITTRSSGAVGRVAQRSSPPATSPTTPIPGTSESNGGGLLAGSMALKTSAEAGELACQRENEEAVQNLLAVAAEERMDVAEVGAASSGSTTESSVQEDTADEEAQPGGRGEVAEETMDVAEVGTASSGTTEESSVEGDVSDEDAQSSDVSEPPTTPRFCLSGASSTVTSGGLSDSRSSSPVLGGGFPYVRKIRKVKVGTLSQCTTAVSLLAAKMREFESKEQTLADEEASARAAAVRARDELDAAERDLVAAQERVRLSREADERARNVSVSALEKLQIFRGKLDRFRASSSAVIPRNRP